MLVKKRRRKPKGEILKIEHFLVPPHKIMKEEEALELLEKMKLTRDQLPRIDQYDPAIAELGAKEGDVVKIERFGEAPYYRIVTRE
jgi:DNA-directed RNA polymerase subunit H (RpoH/RPB5)